MVSNTVSDSRCLNPYTCRSLVNPVKLTFPGDQAFSSFHSEIGKLRGIWIQQAGKNWSSEALKDSLNGRMKIRTPFHHGELWGKGHHSAGDFPRNDHRPRDDHDIRSWERFHPCPPARLLRLQGCVLCNASTLGQATHLAIPTEHIPLIYVGGALGSWSVPLAFALFQSLATLNRRQPRIVKSISRVLVQGTWRHLVGDRRHHLSTARSNKYGLLMLVQDPSLRSCRAGLNNVCGSVIWSFPLDIQVTRRQLS